MNDLTSNENYSSEEEIYSDLFEQLILDLGQTALYFLGSIPDPETGEFTNNLEGAKHIVDQLEMLKYKTKGNLSTDESDLLENTLLNLRDIVGDRFQNLA